VENKLYDPERGGLPVLVRIVNFSRQSDVEGTLEVKAVSEPGRNVLKGYEATIKMGGTEFKGAGERAADAIAAADDARSAGSSGGTEMGFDPMEPLSESRWSQLAGLMVEGGGRYSTQKRPTGAMKTRSIFVEPGDMGRIRNLVKAAASQSKSPLSITAVEGDDDEGFQVQLSGGVMAHNAFKTLEMGPSPQGGEPLTFATEPGAEDLDLSDVLYEDDKTEDEEPMDEGDGEKKTPKPSMIHHGAAPGSYRQPPKPPAPKKPEDLDKLGPFESRRRR
jgi:hypothetical protein